MHLLLSTGRQRIWKNRPIKRPVNEKEIASHTELTTAIARCKISDTVTLTVYRQRQTLELTVTVGEQVQSIKEKKPETFNPGCSGDFPWCRG